MKKHKICEYVNDLGDKYFTVSGRFMFFFWIQHKILISRGLGWTEELMKFDTYEAALEHINKPYPDSFILKEWYPDNFKRKKCTLV